MLLKLNTVLPLMTVSLWLSIKPLLSSLAFFFFFFSTKKKKSLVGFQKYGKECHFRCVMAPPVTVLAAPLPRARSLGKQQKMAPDTHVGDHNGLWPDPGLAIAAIRGMNKCSKVRSFVLLLFVCLFSSSPKSHTPRQTWPRELTAGSSGWMAH